MKYLTIVISVLIGLIIIGVAILGIVDPIGSQMANDNDPYGTPPSLFQNIITLIVGSLFCLGPFIKIRKNKP